MIDIQVRHLTRTELEAGMTTIRQSPADNGRLECIVVRPATDERVTLDVCEVSPQSGVQGDRWAESKLSTKTQVTLMNSRAVALVAQSRERWQLAGDQLYVDLDLGEDNAPAGTRLSIGSAIFEVTEQPHQGCAKFAARFGGEALDFVNSPMGKQLHLRGIYVKVIQAGTIRVGDAVMKM